MGDIEIVITLDELRKAIIEGYIQHARDRVRGRQVFGEKELNQKANQIIDTLKSRGDLEIKEL